MKQIKNILLLLSLSMMLLLAGCSSGTNAKQSGYVLTDSFKGGNTALDISFVDGMPPERIKDNGIGTFDVRLLISNLGEYDVPKDSISVALTGFDLTELGVTESSKTVPIDLRGFKKQGENVIEGAKQFVIFNSLGFKSSIVSGTRDLQISANICYPYETRSVAVACVAGSTLIGVDSKYESCELEGDRSYANSGAPVKIENVKQYSAGESKILIQFDIVHDGNSELGSVYESGSLNSACRVNGNPLGSVNAKNYENKVKYTIDTGLTGLSCEGSNTNTNTVLLGDGTYTVTCEQSTAGLGDAYEKLIRINLEYDYVDRVSKTIKVEHIER